MSKWTPEQEAAITRKGRSLLVSAAAGAGKTAVLVERIIRRVLDSADPVDIDRLLVVTFTNAAAQEMKERIGLALAERGRKNPNDKNITRQFLLLGKSSISTLHSFCLEMIRQNVHCLSLPNGLSLDPRFRIADDIEAGLLKMEILEELFEEKYTEEDPRFFQLVECFGGERDDRILQDLVLKLYDFSCSQPDPFDWLRQAAGTFSSNLEDDSVQILFSNLVDSIILPMEEALDKISEAKEMTMSPGGPAIYLKNLLEEENRIRDVLNLVNSQSSVNNQPAMARWQVVFEELGLIRFGPLKPCRDKDVDEHKKNRVQELRNEAKELIKSLQKEFLSRTPQEFLEDMREIAPLMDSLCALVTDFSESYLRAKFARNVLDFSDIEHFALDLLRVKCGGKWTPSPLAEKMRTYYEEVLVDEYQDINSVQENILTLVSRTEGSSPNMFMVGDVKQSIYGFRLAEPGLFVAKYNSYHKDETGSDPEVTKEKIVLARNFRSRKFIVDGINYIFRQIMSAKLGGLSYDADAELSCGADYPFLPNDDSLKLARSVEVHLIDRDDKEVQPPAGLEKDDESTEESANTVINESEDLDAIQMEARVIGRKIREMTQGVVWDKEKGRYRPLQYRDIVILLRSTKGSALTYLEELSLMGIPAYAETGTGYLRAQEVQVMLALLRIIDNPRQDIPLTAVLRSPVTGLTAHELTAIRMRRPRGDFYDAVRLAARKEEGALGRTLRGFLRQLRRWRTYSRRNSLVKLIWLLFRETGFYDYAGAMPAGKQRQANLRALHDRAKQYENTSMKGLFKFLRFLEKLEESGGDLGIARALGEKEDVVRIMSIHKSKGLEFPVVFLAGLGKKFNHTDLREDILVDRELGLGPVWVDYEKRLKYPTLAKIAVKNKLKERLLAEEMRVLYVALTRARESLVLVGTVKGMPGKQKKWTRVLKHAEHELPVGILKGASSFLDWLGPCLLRYREEQQHNDSSLFKIQFWNPQDITAEQKDGSDDIAALLEKVSRLEQVEESRERLEFVQNRMGWQYPGRVLAAIPAKLTVTEIKNRYHYLQQDHNSSQSYSRWREFTRRPNFLQEDRGLSAGEKGSAFHLVMRHLDISTILTEEEIGRQISNMVAGEIITPQQGESVSPLAIARFFRSSPGERMLKSPRVLREMPFTLTVPAGELYREVECSVSEKIIIQGTIDCLFEEKDGYILLDYKTDLVTEETVNLLKERYRIQMELYSRAVENVFKKQVREKLIYSFCLGEVVSVQ